MQIHMLLGPAGSGKTFRCLREVRDALAPGAEGRPLIFITPKQATFQLERQLLVDGLAGYTRLHIFSFQRLARFIFDYYRKPIPRLLSTEGRVMVLRALLGELRLTIFRSSARRLGFAEEASEQLREFQQHGLGPDEVRRLADEAREDTLRKKLLDLADLYQEFNAWLKKNQLRDEEELLPMAADLVEANAGGLRLGGLWFDGFAQLTPQERRLLSAIVGESERSVLAFCLERPAAPELSPWFLVSQTFARCRAELETRFGQERVQVECLERREGRFEPGSALEHLERAWSSGAVFPGETGALRILECADPETEVVACAREIVRFVRAGNRYRDAAVLLRSFSNEYPCLFRRVFGRYGIPLFLDHREGVAHHPLAVLTRGALRMLVFNWKHVDWFSVLKTGLVRIKVEYLHELENHALENGWEGKEWREGFRFLKKKRSPEREAELLVSLNGDRERLIPPFLKFEKRLGGAPTGVEFAAALRELWAELGVEEKFEAWSRTETIHETVWEQMSAWLLNVELAFAHHRMALREWLPIIEAALNGLTVGVIPPVLDQVLVGTVDRSRNPDLKAIFVLGLNEGVFPAIPPHKPLLTDRDRELLLDSGRELANVPSLQISQEQFYGYIACTRAREKVVLSCARVDGQGKALNASRFIGQVRRIFPRVDIEAGRKPRTLDELEHACELNALLGGELIPDALKGRTRTLPEPNQKDELTPETASELYGDELEVSVVALERFASCPFRFFVEYGLRVKERDEFSLDVREQGTFQHDVLAKYHEEVRKQGRQWRDLSVQEARTLIGRIADELMDSFRGGLLKANDQNRFTGENYKRTLQDFIAAVTGWFETNQFDPAEVELPFGEKEGLPAWEIDLENGRKLRLVGRVDRVDVLRRNDGAGLCLVMDYKAGNTEPNELLMRHGIQQQLLAYLLVLAKVPAASERLGVARLIPAGCFYVPLSAKFGKEKTRDVALRDFEVAQRGAYQHAGIFDAEYLPALDSARGNGRSLQFDYRLKKDGDPHASSFSALTKDRFYELLVMLEESARKNGTEIFQGNIHIHPYRKGSETACKRCKHQPICRFSSWEQDFNVLRKEKKAE